MTKKLVIIDDSSTQLNILKTLFSNNGWEVCGVQSAKIGYELIFDFAPDLIITDAVMPLMGGFQLVKMIRENALISKIPVVVYSVLDKSNAKFYINEELSEYFLKKENNHEQLLELAQKIVTKYPLDEDYKKEILRESLKSSQREQNEINEETKEEELEVQEIQEEAVVEEKKEFDIEKFQKEIENCTNFHLNDEKVFLNFFNVVNSNFEYDLSAINVHSFEDGKKKVFFDIRSIILSPILRNIILKKYDATENLMYKKYAPNLATVVNENEFLSRLEFNFKYKEENIADIILYSKEASKWDNEELNQKIEEIFYSFFKARYIQRASDANKQEDIEQYQQLDKQFDNFKNSTDVYFGVIQIANFVDLTQNISIQEIDILNSKISEKIIACIDSKEQVYKNDEGDYNVVIFAKDEKQARHRFEYIINEIMQAQNDIQVFIAASSCNINETFNIIEAQKNVEELLQSTYQEKVVIYHV